MNKFKKNNDSVEVTGNMDLGQYSPLELSENTINEKAKSVAQQQFFGMVDAYKKGDMPDASPAIKKAAKGMTKKQVKDFAKTKHKGLPEHVDESQLRNMIREGLSELSGGYFNHQLGPDGDVVYGKDEKGFFVYIKKNMGMKYFNTPEEAEEYARKVYKAIRIRKDNDRREFDKQISMDESIIRKMVREALEQSFVGENVYTMEDWKRDGTLKVQEGQLISPEVYYQLLESVPPMCTGRFFQVGEAYDHDPSTGKALYQTFKNEGEDYYRYIGLKPSCRYGINENYNMRQTYSTQGGMTSEDDIRRFKRFVMEYPDLPESSWLRGGNGVLTTDKQVLMLYEDLSRKIYNALPESATHESYHWLCNCWTFVKRGDEKNANFSYRASIKYLVDALNTANLYETVQRELVKTLTDYTQGKASAEKANKAIMNLANSSNGKAVKKNNKVNESANFDAEMAKMDELSKDEFYATLKQIVAVVKEDSIIDAADAINDYPATYCVYGSEPEYEGRLSQLRTSITKSVIRTLYNYDIVYADEETLAISVQQSNVPQAAELCIKLQELCKEQQPMNESYAKDGNYTHFAVHKTANKIVNGWDYSDYDNAELRQFAKDYFINDLIDYDLDPKQYTILTVQGCKKRGIDPFDDSNWANGYELNEKRGEGTNPYYDERHDMEK